MQGHFDYESFDWTGYYEQCDYDQYRYEREYLAWWQSTRGD